MSSFNCEKCGLLCADDGPRGYISGCDHYPVDDKTKPTIWEIIEFTRATCGGGSEEYEVVINLVATCTYRFTDEEIFLIMLLTEAWRRREIR